MLTVFLASATEDAAALDRALGAGAWPLAEELAHRLKGACRMAGAERLAGLAQRVEAALRAGDGAAARRAGLALPATLRATRAAVLAATPGA